MEKFGLVRNEIELQQLVSGLRDKHSNSQLLFRGQTQLYDQIRAARHRAAQPVNGLLEAAWLAFSSNVLGLKKPSHGSGHSKALLQHYGLSTYFLDVTESESIAAWFAVSKAVCQQVVFIGSVFRPYESIYYEKRSEGFGFILVFSIKNPQELIDSERLFNLSVLPESLVRPKRQKAWLLLDRPPTKPAPSDLLIGIIEVDCAAFESSEQQALLFPPVEEDACYAKLLSIPYVETPVGDIEEASEKDEGLMKGLSFATRALPTPEYVKDSKSEGINHKWQDIWIYEPKPMRVWRGWRFDLSSVYPNLVGDIRNTTKIVLSPTAKEVLFSKFKLDLKWPDLGTNGLFFTYAVLDHDKFSDHSDPYHGVWLQKHDEIVTELPMISEDDKLSVSPGHVYFFSEGKLQRQNAEKSCTCPYPESHDARASAGLRLSSAVELGLVLIIPHPRIELCYVAFTERDMEFMRPGIDRTHEMMKAIFAGIGRAKSTA